MTGMLGVYLVAAELSRLDYIVSPTSRSAAGADLLVTDHQCTKAWSVQVKTNRKAAKFWLLSRSAKELTAPSHVYVFVNLKGDQRPDYVVARSADVARSIKHKTSTTGSEWFEFRRPDNLNGDEGWAIFKEPIF
jgi:hypothetical protein